MRLSRPPVASAWRPGRSRRAGAAGSPGCRAEHGVELEDAAWKLSSVLPSVISIAFDPCASRAVLGATVQDIIDAMLEANWEIASHGYRWIDYQNIPEAVERELERRDEGGGERPDDAALAELRGKGAHAALAPGDCLFIPHGPSL